MGTIPGSDRNIQAERGQADQRSEEMTEAIELNDEGLLRRMIAGDESAFTLLYRRRSPAIHRFAMHMSGDAAVAEDVTQETFMTLIRDTGRFDPARGSLSGFLFGIARNHLRKRWERDRRLVALGEDTGDMEDLLSQASASGGSPYGKHAGNGRNGHGALATPRDEFDSLETIGRVRQAVSTLPGTYREVVVLCDLQEMSYEEAASALGCPVGTVRSRLHRARAILIEKLRDGQTARRASAVGK